MPALTLANSLRTASTATPRRSAETEKIRIHPVLPPICPHQHTGDCRMHPVRTVANA
jgi:hypothetical protein